MSSNVRSAERSLGVPRAGSLARSASGAKVPSPPPADFNVSLGSKTQGRTGYFQYALNDGRIWSKWDPVLPREPFTIPCDTALTADQVRARLHFDSPYRFEYDGRKHLIKVIPQDLGDTGFVMKDGDLVRVPRAEASAWHLHDGGGPVLPAGEKLVGFQVASENVTGVSNTGKLYVYDPVDKDLAPKHTGWERWSGQPPNFGQVKLPHGARDWAFGVSISNRPGHRMPLRSTNPFTDIDTYYREPTTGQRGAFNFTPSVGIITADGREIRYRDSGLASDFARGFLTPDKGRFQADKLAQAGSTWLVYGHDRDGKPGLFARQYDYEIFGASPGVRAHLGAKGHHDSGTMQRFSKLDREMPVDGWRDLGLPDIGGPPASLTDRIDIQTTGQGNDARAIRMAGTNEWGQSGYYQRTLTDATWRFTRTTEPLEGKPVIPGRVDPKRTSPNPVAHDYQSAEVSPLLARAGVKSLVLADFHPFQTLAEPSTLKLTLTSGRTVSVLLRTLDGWTSMRSPGTDDVRAIGQGIGVTKVLAGTLDIPADVKASRDPEVRKLLAVLRPLDGAPSALQVDSDQGEVSVRAAGFLPDSNIRVPAVGFRATRNAVGESAYEKRADALVVTPSMTHARLLKLVAEIEATRSSLRTEERNRNLAYVPRVALGGLSTVVFGALQQLAHFTPLRNWAFVRTASDLVAPLAGTQERADERTLKETPPAYGRAMATLSFNLREAKSRLGGA